MQTTARPQAFPRTLLIWGDQNQVLPLFADRDEKGLPAAWLSRIRESLRTLGPLVGAHRMMRDYVTDMYLPAAAGR